jgi:hypothetical protein
MHVRSRSAGSKVHAAVLLRFTDARTGRPGSLLHIRCRPNRPFRGAQSVGTKTPLTCAQCLAYEKTEIDTEPLA